MFSLLMIDVDHFKMFNDKYGHEVGDEALKVLGNYFKKHSRGEDLSCRFGGEEFVIILAATNHVQAIKRAKMLLKEVANVISIAHNNEKLGITISIGVATSPEHGTSRDTLLKSADEALYRAKENGRNRVECAI
ncbi:MAG: GGDEF domain-containing protein [Desulfobulbaceae bacterium]|nr:GGDEF domain-containing protein [Desulfobulbaceae bacterium]